MPLGMEVGLGPGNFVFDGTSYTQKKRAHLPPTIFGPNGWMDQDANCYVGKRRFIEYCRRKDNDISSQGRIQGIFSWVRVTTYKHTTSESWSTILAESGSMLPWTSFKNIV